MRAFRLKSSVPAKNDASWTQWHKRYGHVSMKATKAIARATNVDCEAADRLQKYETQELCESCVSGKITRMPSRVPMTRVTTPGQCWHIDLASASHVTTLGGHTNVMVSTCEASGFTQIDHMTSRAELPNKLEFRIKHWKNQGYKTAFIRSDNELVQGRKCQQLFQEHGILVTPSAPYNPQQNGIAERKNRTLFSKVRTVLIDAGLPQEFWGEAIYYVNYIENLIPGKDGKSPYEKWYGHKPQPTYLKPFGCWCYSFDTSPNKKKLDNKAIKCRFLGHDGKSIYRVWDIKGQRVTRTAHVIFDEKAVMLLMDNNEPLIEGDSDDDNIADLLNQLQMDQSGNSNQVSEGVSGSNRRGVEGVPDTENINNSGNGAATSPPSDQSTTGLNDDVSRGQNSNEQESDDLPDSNENESNYQTASNSRAESELPTGRNQTSQDGSTRQITTVTPSAVINKLSARNNKSQKIVPESSRRSARDKPRIDYSQTNKRGIKTTDNPDGFRAMLTRVVDGTKERPCPTSIDEALRGPDSEQWLAAAEEELANHKKQITW